MAQLWRHPEAVQPLDNQQACEVAARVTRIVLTGQSGKYDRLGGVQASYDSGNTFRVNQNIQPAGGS